MMLDRVTHAGLAVVIAAIAAPAWGGSPETRDYEAPQHGISIERRPRGPGFLHVERNGGLLALCKKSGSIVRLDPRSGIIQTEVPVGEGPFALSAHPDGRRLYVTCRSGQEVVELDAASLEALRRFPLRGDPTGVAVSADGRRLYVGVHSLDQVAVLDVAAGTEIKRLAAGNGPEMVRLCAQKKRVYVTNLLSNAVPAGEPCRNEITVIDDERARVLRRIVLENANVGRGVAFTGDGALAIEAISRPKNLVPMLQVARGWVVTNGFAMVSTDSETPPVQLLVDLPNRAYSDPYAVVVTPDDRKFYLTCAGADTVIAVDLAAAKRVMSEALDDPNTRYADHLGMARRYVSARIAVGAHPTALATSPDGDRLYVANTLDDSISVIDTSTDRIVNTIELGERPALDRLARGERFFHSAGRTYQGQFCCASCHPDNGFDGLRYDLEPDGIGQNILDNRNMRDVVDTGPFKWAGTNPDISTQCGTRTAKWIMRTGWLNSMEVVDLVTYIHSIRPVANPNRATDGKLTAAQKRGKALFERTTTNDGRPLADRDRCNFCHSGRKFTDGRTFDIGSKAPTDTKSKFDTAHLINVFESAPYLHDGRAATLEEMWTVYNLDDTHGFSSDWTKRQLNDLVEYLKSL